MTTRFYLPSTGTPDISPAFGSGWGVTTNADRIDLVTTRISSAMTLKSGVGDAGQDYQLLRQYISAALGAQTISGTIKGQVRMSNSAGTSIGQLAVRVAKCASDGSGVTEILAIADSTTAPGTNPPGTVATLTNRRMEQGVDDFILDLTSTGVNAGDRLIVEIGYDDNSTNTTRFASCSFGDDSATDLPEDETTTAANNPWVEFSMDIAFDEGGGGTTYDVDVSESASAADSVSSQLAAVGALSEAGSAGDSLASAAELVGVLTEAATATDSLAGLLEAAGVLSEAGSAADTLSSLAVLLAALSESASASDTISQSAGGSTYEVSLSEAASAADTIAGLLQAVAAMSESASATDTVASQAALSGALTEAAAASDTLASQAVLAAALSEAAAAIDTLIGLGVLSVALVEVGNATDSMTASGQVVASTQRLIEIRLADRTVRVDSTGRVISVQMAPRTIN